MWNRDRLKLIKDTGESNIFMQTRAVSHLSTSGNKLQSDTQHIDS